MMRNVCEEYGYHTQGLCVTYAKNTREEYAQHTQRIRRHTPLTICVNIRELYV